MDFYTHGLFHNLKRKDVKRGEESEFGDCNPDSSTYWLQQASLLDRSFNLSEEFFSSYFIGEEANK